jgi:4-hydroxy-L-threonine phosphate dehydrogenase PdxA
MPLKPILIVPGQINSIFFEIFFKSLKKIENLSPLVLICSLKIFKKNAKKYNFKRNYNLVSYNFDIKFNNKFLNIIDIEFQLDKDKKKQIKLENKYLLKCFTTAFKIIKDKHTYKFLNGPINKQVFLKKKFLGITEFITKKFNKINTGMLIYNKNLSVCFYIKNFNIKPKIGVTGLNPHCESVSKFNEDDKIIMPAIKYSKKKKILAYGPYSADTIFLKQNRTKFDVILGMYHDQVLTPLKTLYEYDAINITMGLSFLRVSPDHGPNEKMIKKNSSSPISLIKALEFLDKI